MIPDHVRYPKIARWNRELVVTEKIDGTNGQIYVPEDPAEPLLAGSRNRWLAPDDDNFGFAAWVAEHADELWTLGPGRHFGEWYGKGIQRAYGMQERRFALFHERWQTEAPPACCDVVPVLYAGPVVALQCLAISGSVLVPGYVRPEGIVIRHTGNGALFKWTFDGDAK